MSCEVKNGFYAGNIHYRVVQSDNTLVFRSVRMEHETQAKYETCSCSNTDAYTRFSVILNDTLQVFSGVWLEHETHAKYETCSRLNTDAYAAFKGILNDTLQVF